jgi:hypothetical protein
MGETSKSHMTNIPYIIIVLVYAESQTAVSESSNFCYMSNLVPAVYTGDEQQSRWDSCNGIDVLYSNLIITQKVRGKRTNINSLNNISINQNSTFILNRIIYSLVRRLNSFSFSFCLGRIHMMRISITVIYILWVPNVHRKIFQYTV